MKTLALLHHAVSSVRRALSNIYASGGRPNENVPPCALHHADIHTLHAYTLSSFVRQRVLETGAMQRMHGSSL